MSEAQNVLDLRNAIAKGGRVAVAPGRYYFKDTLVLSGATSLVGDYRDLCILDFSGVPVAIRADRMWGYEIRNLTITGDRSGIGILNSTDTPNANGIYGTCSGSAIYDHVIISGFKKGLVVGDQTRYIAASENVYNHLQVANCDVGIELNDYNTLDHYFQMLQIGNCNMGLVTNGASYITVQSGSFSSIKGVLFNMGSCSAARFRDCRMEESNVFFLGGTTCTVSNYVIEGCLMHQRASLATENTQAYANGWKNPVIVGGSAVLTLKNNFISTTTPAAAVLNTHNCPGGLIEATGNTSNASVLISPNTSKTTRVYARNNQMTDTGQVFKSWYPDA